MQPGREGDVVIGRTEEETIIATSGCASAFIGTIEYFLRGDWRRRVGHRQHLHDAAGEGGRRAAVEILFVFAAGNTKVNMNVNHCRQSYGWHDLWRKKREGAEAPFSRLVVGE